jgi:predicted Zn-dependent protease
LTRNAYLADGYTYLFRADTLLKAKRYSEALLNLTFARALLPKLSTHHQLICEIYLMMGKTEFATALAADLERKFPGNQSVTQTVARIRAAVAR